MNSYAVFFWGAWAVLFVVGLCLAVMRSTETGFAYVNLPRLFYFVWILACVVLFGVLGERIAAVAGALLAVVVGALALAGDEPAGIERRRDMEERLAGCRRTLEKDPRNPMSLELIGDVFSTLEEPVRAREYWQRSYDIAPGTKLREKLAALERRPPVFYYWGNRVAHELRACAKCEAVLSSLDYACSRCGTEFYPDRPTWLATRFNRLCDETGAGSALETGLVLLPFMYFCDPLAYVAVWLTWAGARRPGPKTVS